MTLHLPPTTLSALELNYNKQGFLKTITSCTEIFLVLHLYPVFASFLLGYSDCKHSKWRKSTEPFCAERMGGVSWRQDFFSSLSPSPCVGGEAGGGRKEGFQGWGGWGRVVWGLRAVVGYASATCLAWHLLLLDWKDVGLRVWLSLSGCSLSLSLSLNQKCGECCTLLPPVITLTFTSFRIRKSIIFWCTKVCRERRFGMQSRMF